MCQDHLFKNWSCALSSSLCPSNFEIFCIVSRYLDQSESNDYLCHYILSIIRSARLQGARFFPTVAKVLRFDEISRCLPLLIFKYKLMENIYISLYKYSFSSVSNSLQVTPYWTRFWWWSADLRKKETAPQTWNLLTLSSGRWEWCLKYEKTVNFIWNTKNKWSLRSGITLMTSDNGSAFMTQKMTVLYVWSCTFPS